jgi:hypothetical protein
LEFLAYEQPAIQPTNVAQSANVTPPKSTNVAERVSQLKRRRGHLDLRKLWAGHGREFEQTRIDGPLGRRRGQDSATSCRTKIDRKRFSERGIFGQAATTVAVLAATAWQPRAPHPG